MISSHSSSSTDSEGLKMGLMPAQCTKTSSRPKRRSVRSTILRTSAAEATEPGSITTSAPGRASRTSCSSAAVREVSTSRASAAARPWAMARPIPRPAPVTQATFRRRSARAPRRSSGAHRTRALAKLAFEHLAGGVARQRIDELHLLRDLEPGQALAAMLDELLGGDLGPRPEDDEGLGDLAPAWIGDADDRGLHDRRMLVQGALHLGGGDVLPAGDDEVLLAILDVEVAVFVDPPDVPGVKPAVPDGGCRRLWVSPVALEHFGASKHHLAQLVGQDLLPLLVDDPNREMDDRLADRPDLGDHVLTVHEGVPGHRLGEAVGVGEPCVGEGAEDPLDEWDRHLFPAVDDEAHGACVVRLQVGEL